MVNFWNNFMNGIKTTFFSHYDKDFFTRNHEDIEQHNYEVLNYTLIAGLVIFVFINLSYVFLGVNYVSPFSLLPIGIFIFLYHLFYTRVSLHKEYARPLLYMFMTVCYCFSIYIGVFNTPDGTAGTFIALVTVTPFMILDRPARVNSFIAIFSVIFVILSYMVKGFALARLDFINVTIFFLLCTILGKNISNIRLHSIEAKHLLELQRDTDILTTLPNRAKLTEAIDDVGDVCLGIMMIDIDKFKQYNDYYGHQKGDECLHKVGVCLKKFADKNEIRIYRYGGEEFIGAMHNVNYNRMNKIITRLQNEVRDLKIENNSSGEEGYITFSCGFACQGTVNADNIEHLIKKADIALYECKKRGRNMSLGYNEYMNLQDKIAEEAGTEEISTEEISKKEISKEKVSEN